MNGSAFFFFFWVLVYCAEAGRAYVTHYATERRGAKGGRDRKLKYANQCRLGLFDIQGMIGLDEVLDSL